MTRAKKKLILLGSMEVLKEAIQCMEPLRQTGLLNLLQKTKDDSQRILDPNIPFDILGEYDMEGITPYTFME